MPNNNENESQDILNAISDISFLPKEPKDENEGREFLKIGKKERLFRFVWTLLVAALCIAFLVCLFVFGMNGYYFSSQVKGSYGWFGIIVTAIFALSFCAQMVISFLNDCKFSNSDDPKTVALWNQLAKNSYHITFFLLYGMFLTTILRKFVFTTFFFGDNWFLQNLGNITIVIIFLISIGANFLSAKKSKIGKVCNLALLAISGWIVIFFSSMLTKNYSMQSNYGIMLLIFGAIFIDLAVPFFALEKKYPGMRSAATVMLTIAFVFESLSVLIYGMALLGA